MEASAQPVQLKEIDLTLIDISGMNPRKDIKGESFKELKASVQEHGILEPLLVRPKGPDRYELVAGERRLTAAKELKLEMVPVAIRELDDHSAWVLMLLENLQREDLQPLEEASALEELLKDGSMTQSELAKRLGKSQPWVANRVRLLKAPPELKKLLQKGDITPQHIVALLPYVDRKELKSEVLSGLKIALEEVQWNGPVTVESVKEMVDDIVSEQGQELDLANYHYQGLGKYFDRSKCDSCTKILQVTDEDSKRKARKICLDKNCFAQHIEEARQKLAEDQKEKISKSEVIKTDKLEYGSYVSFDDEYRKPNFDTSVCKDCPNHKLQKPRYARFGKGKGELEEVCLKPSCFRAKISQVTRVTNQKCREELAFAEESFKRYLASRSSPLTEEELRFILDRIDMAVTPKKGATIKDLEGQLLSHIMSLELRDFKYNPNLAELKQLEPEWPFKVSRAKDPEQPKKKVQEKRPKREG